jgi:hypothetical protein
MNTVVSYLIATFEAHLLAIQYAFLDSDSSEMNRLFEILNSKTDAEFWQMNEAVAAIAVKHGIDKMPELKKQPAKFFELFPETESTGKFGYRPWDDGPECSRIDRMLDKHWDQVQEYF